jgi:CrcB protein
MKIWGLIFLGGGIGSLCRYLLSRLVTINTASSFPYGTFIVNITGCLMIGFFVFYFTEGRFGVGAMPWRLFLVTGLCGGFTTFSAFSFENVQLLSSNHIFTFLAYTFGSIAIGLLATYSGILLAKAL